MRRLVFMCCLFAVLHAAIMTAFAVGPELSPLVVWMVDAPVAVWTVGMDAAWLGLTIPIVACSILYPLVLFCCGWLVIRVRARRRAPNQSPEPTSFTARNS